jgi:NAD(P)H-dependent flavin oxidoreductase YrpB (nitropropane dioxygenase family)
MTSNLWSTAVFNQGGGHTGDVATSILIPKVVDLCAGHKSPLTGGPVLVVAAGGIYDGRGLAMALSLGAAGVWVGTRFICAKEAGAPPYHQVSGFVSMPLVVFFRPFRCRKQC